MYSDNLLKQIYGDKTNCKMRGSFLSVRPHPQTHLVDTFRK